MWSFFKRRSCVVKLIIVIALLIVLLFLLTVCYAFSVAGLHIVGVLPTFTPSPTLPLTGTPTNAAPWTLTPAGTVKSIPITAPLEATTPTIATVPTQTPTSASTAIATRISAMAPTSTPTLTDTPTVTTMPTETFTAGPTNTPTLTATPRPTATPKPTEDTLHWIPGLNSTDIKLNLEQRFGMTCGGPERAVIGSGYYWWCEKSIGLKRFDAMWSGESPWELDLLEASTLGVDASTAVTYLQFVATMPYDDAEPQQAATWVGQNIGNEAITTIGSAKFTLLSSSGNAYTLDMEATLDEP